MSNNSLSYIHGKKNTVKLTSLTLHKDSNGHYLSAKYRIEDEHSIRELDIPQIRLGVSLGCVAIRQTGEVWTQMEADIGFGYRPLAPSGRNCAYFTETVLEEKTHEMTLDEIEKKLGYKVKIVSEKARDDKDTSCLGGLDF